MGTLLRQSDGRARRVRAVGGAPWDGRGPRIPSLARHNQAGAGLRCDASVRVANAAGVARVVPTSRLHCQCGSTWGMLCLLALKYLTLGTKISDVI